MKFLIKTLIFLLCNFCNSQIISGIIVDSISKKPIDLANISFTNSNYNVLSDSEGYFKIDCINPKENLLVSNIGYKNKKLKLSIKENKYIIFLTPETQELKEVVIFNNNKKINYSWDKFLKTKRENSQYFGFQFGTEHCTYIANPYRKTGKIKSVSLELEKLKGYLEDRKYKVDYIASYNIKFYNFNNKSNRPGTEIYNKNIIIDPQNKTYTLTIAVDSLHIPFPENGICVGVEIINTKYQNPKKTFAFIGPLMNFSENSECFPIASWIRYRYNGKWEFEPQMGFLDRKEKKQSMLVVDLVVNIEK